MTSAEVLTAWSDASIACRFIHTGNFCFDEGHSRPKSEIDRMENAVQLAFDRDVFVVRNCDAMLPVTLSKYREKTLRGMGMFYAMISVSAALFISGLILFIIFAFSGRIVYMIPSAILTVGCLIVVASTIGVLSRIRDMQAS